MNKALVAAALTLITTLVLTACTTVEGSRADAEDSGPPACFYADDVQYYEILDRQTLIVYAPGRSRAYRVRVHSLGSELRSSDAIVFTSRGRRICGFAGDALKTGGFSGREYSVLSVERLDEATLDFLLQARDGSLEALQAEEDPALAEIQPLDDDAVQVE